jgi:nicotinamide mononucleotide adenylyltransferase
VIVPPTINNVSSTKLRLLVKRGQRIKYLAPDPVVDYIEKHALYQQEEPSSTTAEED